MSSPPFNAFIGPAYIMISCAFMLYGTFCAQLYYYWVTYDDSVALQSFVGLVAILESAHTALCIHILYEYLINLWGDPTAAAKIIFSVTASTYLELTVSSLVQAWYIHRIWRLRRQMIPTGILMATLCAHIAISFRSAAYTNKYSTWQELYADRSFSVDVNCTFGLNIALDASITSVLMFYLLRDRSKAAKRSTRKMMRSLINFAFSAGILTMLTSCGLFIALNVAKRTLTFGGMIQFIAKLYANSMLAVLNARQSVIEAAAADTKFGLVELSRFSPSKATTNTPMEPITFRTHATVSLANEKDTWNQEQDSHTSTESISPPGVKLFDSAEKTSSA